MIDWYVALVPLLLIPVFLLFVFTGCVLDRQGQAPTVMFEYSPGLKITSSEGPGLEGIEWEYHFSLQWDQDFGEGVIGSAPGDNQAGPFTLVGDEIDNSGGNHTYELGLETYGLVTCKCKVTTKSNSSTSEPSQTIVLDDVVHQKVEDELLPRFELVRVDAGFDLK